MPGPSGGNPARGAPLPLGDFQKSVGDIGTFIADSIVSGAGFVKKVLSDTRAEVVRVIADAVKDPWAVVGIVVGSLSISILLSFLYDYLKGLEWVQKTIAFIAQLTNFFGQILAFLQVDTVIALLNLGAQFDDYLNQKLTEVYEALGALSEEIGRDFSFVPLLAEVNRTILFTAYQMTESPWLKAQAEYAKGMSTFLGGIRNKLADYARDPDKIYMDLLAFVSKSRLEIPYETRKEIFGMIAVATDWISVNAQRLISAADKIFALERQIDPTILSSMQVWYGPFKEEYRKFRDETFAPFKETIEIWTGAVDEILERNGIDLEKLKREMRDPANWIKLFQVESVEAKKEISSDVASIVGLRTIEENVARIGSAALVEYNSEEEKADALKYTPPESDDTRNAARPGTMTESDDRSEKSWNPTDSIGGTEWTR